MSVTDGHSIEMENQDSVAVVAVSQGGPAVVLSLLDLYVYSESFLIRVTTRDFRNSR